MLESLLQLDESLLIYLNNLGSEAYDDFWVALSEVLIWAPLYAAIVLALGWAYRWRSFAIALLFIALNATATDQGSVRLFKNQFERLRPCHQTELQDQLRLPGDRCGGRYGFVSSHATNTFGLAFLAGLMLRRRWSWAFPALVIWAAMVSYSRVYLGVHFPGDILGGALLGGLLGTLFYLLFQKWTKPRLR